MRIKIKTGVKNKYLFGFYSLELLLAEMNGFMILMRKLYRLKSIYFINLKIKIDRI